MGGRVSLVFALMHLGDEALLFLWHFQKLMVGSKSQWSTALTNIISAFFFVVASPLKDPVRKDLVHS